jgi:hypothetical protein
MDRHDSIFALLVVQVFLLGIVRLISGSYITSRYCNKNKKSISSLENSYPNNYLVKHYSALTQKNSKVDFESSSLISSLRAQLHKK